MLIRSFHAWARYLPARGGSGRAWRPGRSRCGNGWRCWRSLPGASGAWRPRRGWWPACGLWCGLRSTRSIAEASVKLGDSHLQRCVLAELVLARGDRDDEGENVGEDAGYPTWLTIAGSLLAHR